MRDYVRWHEQYDDAGSSLSWRLGEVRRHLHAELDLGSGPVTVLSACAGDGRDILGVLAERPDYDRVSATLVELNPGLAARARVVAADAGFGRVGVRVADAGLSDSYLGAAPADVVLLVGIFGNVSDDDIERTVLAAPALCSPGALVLWSRSTSEDDRNGWIRDAFVGAGFSELDYSVSQPVTPDHAAGGDRSALGAVRLTASPVPLEPGRALFTFVR